MTAGMGGVTLHELAAAASNAGGIGTLGAVPFTEKPEELRAEIKRTKALLNPGVTMFGVDLLLPSTDEGARKTNKGVGNDLLDTICDVMIEEEVPLFVCAVGVPPLFVVEKLHEAGIIVMNMIGKPRHAEKALAVGCDIICAQGTEGGGHTGEIATLPLIPQICDAVRGKTNFFGTQVPVIAAGGIFDGRGVAACMMLGAAGVWLGTRFLVAEEANVNDEYKQIVINSKSEDTTRIEIFSGRPMRVIRTDYTDLWETPEKVKEMHELSERLQQEQRPAHRPYVRLASR
jgi:NAD(P)H-dependent flavin oxidoreductase YrpB (nitropropane dioxygenase family)